MRILVAEDDRGLVSVLERGLHEAGYTVDAVVDGEAALFYLRVYEYAAAVIDWRMPKTSGLEVVETVRRRGLSTPILMLTARDATTDRVTGLDRGADDYLVKPFEFAELMARLRALLRRPGDAAPPVLRCGALDLDPATRQAHVEGRRLSLTPTELAILELLIRKAPQVVRRATIAVAVWNDEADALGSNTIDVHMARLRGKLVGAQAVIETVRGAGYRVRPS
ncbi:MAG: response regulator transcription factor [Acidimicrobiales bacterium]